MHLESSKSYEMPIIATFYEVKTHGFSPLEVIIGTDNNIYLALSKRFHDIKLKNYLMSIPIRKNKDYWLIEGRWAAVFHSELELPFWFNKVGKRVCLLCNGKNTIAKILEIMVKSYPTQSPDKLMKDTINFIFLLKKIKLLILRKQVV